MDVQTDISHVVKMLAGNKPDDLADLTFGIIAGQASKGLRFDLFILCQLRHIVQCGAFRVAKRPLVLYSSSASNLASFIDPLIVNDRAISIQKEQTLTRATCSRMSRTVSGGSVNILSSLLIFV